MTQASTTMGAVPARKQAPVAVPSVVLIGLNGFGRQHLANIERLVAAGKMEFLAGVDRSDPGPEVRGEGLPVFESVAELVAAGLKPDIVIVSTPISTHAPLGLEALETGADLYVEKPPTATFAQFEQLLEAANKAGARVQVGFQALGSHALDAIDGFFANGAAGSPIGKLRAVAASGTWIRTREYYDRAPWAGRRVLNGVDIVDGVVTNPLAHAVSSALHIAGAKLASDVDQLAVELYHAHGNEADDTSVVQLRTTSGIPVTAALTVCAKERTDPWITIFGTEGKAVFYYTRDELHVTPNPDLDLNPYTAQYERTNLLENLIDVQRGTAAELLSPLANAGAFMRVLEAVRTSEDPAPIAAEQVEPAGEGSEFHPVVPNIARYIDRAAAAQTGFSSLGAPWAAPAPTAGSLQLDGADVAVLRTGEDIAPSNSPRPFLDRVRTLGGVMVSDQQPLDHTWHLGVGVALQDVDGNNFWGGRTYTRADQRYVWRDDHGSIRTVSNDFSDDGRQLASVLEWVGHDGSVLIDERRTTTVERLDDQSGSASGWVLDLSYELSARNEAVSLGSPGSNGRVAGGYGGFFWRLPQVAGARVFTGHTQGEEESHGTVSDWLAFTGSFSSDAVALAERGSGHGTASLVFCSQANDPWFVRAAGYPGVGSSLAWDKPVIAEPGQPVSRRVRVLVLDGEVSEQQAAQLAARYGASL